MPGQVHGEWGAVRGDNIHRETASRCAQYVTLGKRSSHLPGGGTPIVGHLEIDGIAPWLVHHEVIVRFIVVPDLIRPSIEASLAAVWGRNGISHLGRQRGTDCPNEGEGVARLQYTARSHAS